MIIVVPRLMDSTIPVCKRISLRTIDIARICVARYPITPIIIAIAIKNPVVLFPYLKATASGNEIDPPSSEKSLNRFPNRKNEILKPISDAITIHTELIPIL